jgi:hypothetical protein
MGYGVRVKVARGCATNLELRFQVSSHRYSRISSTFLSKSARFLLVYPREIPPLGGSIKIRKQRCHGSNPPLRNFDVVRLPLDPDEPALLIPTRHPRCS